MDKKTSLSGMAATIAMIAAGAVQAEIQDVQLEVIVGNHTDPFTKEWQIPYFTEKMTERSDGKIQVNAVPYTELGLSGFELMNLLKLGTNDISWGVPGYVAGDSPAVEGLELPGITDDFNVMFKVQEAYRPIFARELNEKFNAKLLGWTQQPALQAYCKLSEEESANFSLATLSGKKMRVHSTSFADFAEAMGANPITMPFPEVIPALESGVIDCAITSPSAAYGYGFGQVITDVVAVPAGYSTHFFAMNNDSWNSLNAETQAFLIEQFNEMEEGIRGFLPEVEADMAACLGDGPCEAGEPAGAALQKLNEADAAALKAAVEATVLARWAERCGSECAAEWNGAIGDIVGMAMPTE